MAQTINYNKICPNCKGNPYKVRWVKRRITNIFSKIFYFLLNSTHKMILIKVCNNCELGIIRPKTVIVRTDRMENEVIY